MNGIQGLGIAMMLLSIYFAAKHKSGSRLLNALRLMNFGCGGFMVIIGGL